MHIISHKNVKRIGTRGSKCVGICMYLLDIKRKKYKRVKEGKRKGRIEDKTNDDKKCPI